MRRRIPSDDHATTRRSPTFSYRRLFCADHWALPQRCNGRSFPTRVLVLHPLSAARPSLLHRTASAKFPNKKAPAVLFSRSFFAQRKNEQLVLVFVFVFVFPPSPPPHPPPLPLSSPRHHLIFLIPCRGGRRRRTRKTKYKIQNQNQIWFPTRFSFLNNVILIFFPFFKLFFTIFVFVWFILLDRIHQGIDVLETDGDHLSQQDVVLFACRARRLRR